jgi:SAM-dependent methyltransferase
MLQDLFLRLGMAPVPISQHAKQPSSGVYLHASKQWEYLFVFDQIGQVNGVNGDRLKIGDIGGGRGALGAYLGSLGHYVDVFDKDYLWDHGGDITVGARYMGWAKSHGYGTHCGSLHNLPVEDETFDVVTSVSVVEHVPYKEYLLKEAFRVLKPGGLLILTFDFAVEPQRFEDNLRREIFSPQRLEATLAAFGITSPGFTNTETVYSVEAIQRDKVLGIPVGMTVGGIALQKIARAPLP